MFIILVIDYTNVVNEPNPLHVDEGTVLKLFPRIKKRKSPGTDAAIH